jgi:folate-binding protein YgfZ
MSAAAAALGPRVRAAAGLFVLADRALLSVEGADRERWLDGMLSNSVAACAPGRARSGCYALLLTPQGRITADVHVLHRGATLWLELAAAAARPARARLEKHIIADDVRIRDESARFARLALEGPRAAEILAPLLGGAVLPALDSWSDARVASVPVTLAGFGTSGEEAYQIFAPRAQREAVLAALRAAGRAADLVEGTPALLEQLRIEAGVPRYGTELGEDVLPAEVPPLARAVSLAKGCYTGQEIVARMASRGRAAQQLVGLRLPRGALPAPGAALEHADRRVGEITSVCDSETFGAIGLGFVRAAHAAVGSELRAEGRSVRVAALPFVGAER